MVKNFLDDPKHYKFKAAENNESFLSRKMHLFEKYIPEKYRKRLCGNVSQLQYCYLNYKNKCHSEDGGLACTKSHAHDREIVSDVANPCKRFLRLVARAFRIVKMCSRELV